MKNLHDYRDRFILYNNIYNNLGWHTQETFDRSASPCTYNMFVISGYLPAFAILTAVAKIHEGTNSFHVDQLSLRYRAYMIIRGSLELIGLGILFLIPDLIVSFHRHFCSAALNSHLNKN